MDACDPNAFARVDTKVHEDNEGVEGEMGGDTEVEGDSGSDTQHDNMIAILRFTEGRGKVITEM
jgi:hypothetical protein